MAPSEDSIRKKQKRTNAYRQKNREAYNDYIREYRKDKAAGRVPKPLSFFIEKHGGDVSPEAKKRRHVKGQLKGRGLLSAASEILETVNVTVLREKGPGKATSGPSYEARLRQQETKFGAPKIYHLTQVDGKWRVLTAPSGTTPEEELMTFREAALEANERNAET